MFHVDALLVGKVCLHNYAMEHLPRTGDILRFSAQKFGRVIEIIWAEDYFQRRGVQRIRLTLVPLVRSPPV